MNIFLESISFTRDSKMSLTQESLEIASLYDNIVVKSNDMTGSFLPRSLPTIPSQTHPKKMFYKL